MSIKSTKYITREFAIRRIVLIDELAGQRRYRTLADETGEWGENDVQQFVDSYGTSHYTEEALSEWTDKMLADKLDNPFFRESIFDNYLIKG